MFEFCLITLISVLFFVLNVWVWGWGWIPRERTITKLRLVENLWKLLITLCIWLLFGKAEHVQWHGMWGECEWRGMELFSWRIIWVHGMTCQTLWLQLKQNPKTSLMPFLHMRVRLTSLCPHTDTWCSEFPCCLWLNRMYFLFMVDSAKWSAI